MQVNPGPPYSTKYNSGNVFYTRKSARFHPMISGGATVDKVIDMDWI